MKTKVTILILGLLAFGCSKDENECSCDVEMTIDGTSTYTVTNVPSDCNGNVDKNDLNPNHFFLRTKNCN